MTFYGIFAETAKTPRNPSGYIHGTRCVRCQDAQAKLREREANGDAFPGEFVRSVLPGDIPTGWT